jgi:hypothetical protein
MLTYTGARNYYGKLTNNTDSDNLILGDQLINESIKEILSSSDWPFLETSSDITTVESQQFYDIPADADKIIQVVVNVGTYNFVPYRCPSREGWELMNQTQQFESSYPQWYYVTTDKIGLYPISSQDGDTITIYYTKTQKDLSQADYATGTITTATNGDKTIVGSGTTWIDDMTGRYIRIDSPGGDNQWYKIASITSNTELELSKNYQGSSISSGSASYTIGEVSIIPEQHQRLPVYKAAEIYFLTEQPDPNRSDRFKRLFDEGMQKMTEEYERSTDPVCLDTGDFRIDNPNLYVEL